MRISRLGLVEGLGLTIWLVLAGLLLHQGADRSTIQPIDPKALVLGVSKERWMGIFFEDQHVGFSVQRSAPIADGGVLFEGRSQFRVATFGKIQQVLTAGTALVDGEGQLRRFDFVMLADQVRLVARGEVKDSQILMEVDQAGQVSKLEFDVERPPHVGMSLESVIHRHELAVGLKVDVPFFDPLTLADGSMEIEVTGVEILSNGEEAYWIVSRFGEVETRSLVTPAGETLRQEGSLGMSMVRMTEEEAQVISDEAPRDLITMSQVPLKGRIRNARRTRKLKLKVGGIPLEKVRHEPPLQTVEDGVVTIDIPLELELPALPLITECAEEFHDCGIDGLCPDDPEYEEQDTGEADGSFNRQNESFIDCGCDQRCAEDTGYPGPDEGEKDQVYGSEYLVSTPSLPVQHLDIQKKAREVIGDATDRTEATQRLVQFVFDYVAKEPTLGVPNGLEVLYSKRGDCNEHTALFSSLARASGIPTRIAAGVVYSNRVGPKGAFYYHAWPEVRLGGPTDWVPVDPTFGQFPADATHLKLVEGDLDRQVEILGVIGRLNLAVVKAR